MTDTFLDGSGPVCVGDLLAIPGFGMASLLELMCVAEVAIPMPLQVSASLAGIQARSGDPARSYEHTAWREVSDSLELLFAAANEFYGAITVSDALELDLHELASDLGMGAAVDSYRIEAVTDIRILDTIVDVIRDLRTTISERELIILEEYVFARTRTTLEELGTRFGVSRERIRQIKTRIADEVNSCVGREIDTIAATLRRMAGPVVSEDDLRSLVDSVFGDQSRHDPAVDLTRRIVEAGLGYDCVSGVCATRAARSVLDGFAKHAAEIADEVGLVDEERLRAWLPGEEWCRLFDLLIDRRGLVRLGDHLALRATRKSRAKAAILSIGRPATLDEIMSASGLPRTHLGGLLSGIPGIARASKTKWGMQEWIEDEYEGIAAEIKQRIEEDGGSTTLDRLISELPQMFEVKEASVRSLIATPQFVMRDGSVRLAEEWEVTLRDIDDVVDGVTAKGHPYWTFRVQSSYFNGYSLAGVPPEIAHALGCPKNGNIRAVVSHPQGCRRISVIWSLTSVSGASIGHISKPLRQLGVGDGDHVSLVIVGPGVAEFRRCDHERRNDRTEGLKRSDEAVAANGAAAHAESSALLERLKRRRQVF